MMDFDLLFRGALLIDGSSERRADLGVRGDRIAAIGPIPDGVACGREIDARGLVLCPGFIDIHTHSDVSLLLDPRGESKVLQGVTTEVVGNCGFSAFPVDPARVSLHEDLLAGIGDDPVPLRWADLATYAAAIEARRPAINVAPLVGHGAVRIAAMGIEPSAADEDQLRAMEQLVATAMRQGAWGLSTGLTYVPSGFGSLEEIAALARVVAAHGGIYATHARAVAGGSLDAIREAAEIGRRSGARVQFSHLAINEPRFWGTARTTLEVFERTRAEGVDIAFDVYPYDASASALTQYLPAWVQIGGTAAMAERLADPALRRQAREELATGWYGGIPWDWERVVVSRCGDEQQFVGRSLQMLAEQAQVDPAEITLQLCERYGNRVQVVLFYRMEEDMRAFLAHELASVGSDGSAIPLDQHGNRPHPRFYGAFPRVLGRYAREQGDLSLRAAIHKMTAAPAERLGMRDRGRLDVGLIADLTVFDADRVADRATYTDPCRAPVGIVYVVVNGQVAVDQERQTAARPGRVVLKG